MANENDTTEFGFRNGNVTVSQDGDKDRLVIESMVGPLINTLPVRVRLDGDRPVGAWLQACWLRRWCDLSPPTRMASSG